MTKKQPLPWSRRYIPPGLTLVLGVGLSILAFALIWNWEDRRRDYEFNRRIDDIAIALERQINTDLDVILALGDYMRATNQVDRSSFARFVARPLAIHYSLQILAWSPRLPDTQRQNYEAKARSDKDPNFEITERNSLGKLVTASQRPEYFPVYYVEPLAQNQEALGLDLASSPAIRAALDQARDTGEMVVTKNINLVAGDRSELGLLAIQPVYQNGTQPSTIGDRHKLLQGFVLGVFQVKDIFQTSLKGRNTEYMNFYLTNTTSEQQNKSISSTASPHLPANNSRPSLQTNNFAVLYDSSSQKVIPAGPQIEQAANLNCPIQSNSASSETACRLLLNISGRQWSLYVLTTPEFRRTQKHWRSWGSLIMGLLWTLIPVTYMLTALSRTRQIEKLAEESSNQAKKLQQAYKQLELEQAKSEQLLLNVLPAPIAQRLKRDEHNIADTFGAVTVMFADIVGFTELSSRISPSELVGVLNDIFSAFDHLADKHGLEKIKTIGDAYMVVGGLPVAHPDHAEAIAEMALDMLQEIRRLSVEHNEAFSIRIGINSGPVIAGVIGLKRFIYDLWGDTVNIASRMESHGMTGCIQVTAATYELLRQKYLFEKRGAIQIKGKGYMTTYLLTGRGEGDRGRGGARERRRGGAGDSGRGEA
ncbi:adenylate/guanylate cyclase domain-containing protein [Kamptonema sp. UHCC 0994]|uniref:adenylate/guanylate cyclase domain-containing protein n=1 Tax=Kamptonema sp. UHCC 0994 TaxID=3031329 RepID=UPI0023B9F7BC|nr:adenylate/guanylate cyclase domain-containing protein [Kamptonema sp. UHCC 0994]MDF0555771.1 adenylate/guanylate cyclase domain-containing protein [Kamptonema sp. UHCC 0994]